MDKSRYIALNQSPTIADVPLSAGGILPLLFLLSVAQSSDCAMFKPKWLGDARHRQLGLELIDFLQSEVFVHRADVDQGFLNREPHDRQT